MAFVEQKVQYNRKIKQPKRYFVFLKVQKRSKNLRVYKQTKTQNVCKMYAKLTFRNIEFFHFEEFQKAYFLHTKIFGLFPNNHEFCRQIKSCPE